MIYIGIQNDSAIEHHGILGQRWGVRRYQNEDGTLTPAGKDRYREDKALSKKEQRYLEGKRLYSEGKTIDEYKKKELLVNAGSVAASSLVGAAIAATGKTFVAKLGKRTTMEIPSSTAGRAAAFAILAGAAIGSSIYFGKKKKALRAYYAGHPKNYETTDDYSNYKMFRPRITSAALKGLEI